MLSCHQAFAQSAASAQVLTAVAAGFLISQGASWTSRLYLYPGIAFAIAFVDSARQGLCTESLVSPDADTENMDS